MKPRSNTRHLSGTRSVVRAISVLKTLGRSGSAYGITELGAATGLSKATIFRLLGALETEGMVSRDMATATYRLGPELIALGASALSTTDLRAIAHDELVRLAHESGETATLEVLSDGEILVVDEAQGRFLFGATPEIGRCWPAHATSTGKILLALTDPMPPVLRLAKFGSKTITTRVELDRELARVRHNGYALAIDELEPGLSAIAAPIRNHFGYVIAALSINGPGTRLGPKRRRILIPKVLRAANRVSRRLGASPAMIVVSDRKSSAAS
ncbi:MAG TPA: IclR family transcriptional regulator [Gemmatimonadaceae bacterium]|nr:IclR family transcriptional regulator [Gemmatimonadaceae bacterium]